MANTPVVELTLRRTKAQLRLTGKSKILGRLLRDNRSLQRTIHLRMNEYYASPIPVSFWCEELANEGGHTIRLDTPMPASRLEEVMQRTKRAIESFLQEYATPYEATITIVRGDLEL